MEKKKLSLKEIGKDKLLIMLLAGILLLFLSLPSFGKAGESIPKEKQVTQEIPSSSGKDDNELYIEAMEKKLKNTLSMVDGLGNTEVMITLKGSKEKVTLKDEPYTQENSNETDGTGGTRVNSSVTKEDETVMVSNGNGDSQPYIVKETEPEIEGVLVLCEGGNNGKIINEIVDAVQVLFNVPPHKIKVMKMESRTK